MNIRTISSILLASFLIISCKKELEPQQSTVTETELPATTTPSTATMQEATPQMQAPTQAPNATAMPQQSAPQSVAKGMNPAHGQPGHRCDIAVGAPLSSAPAISSQTTMGSSTAKVTPANVSTNGIVTPTPSTTASSTPALLNPSTATAAGMNPPHGQAGHRCDIAVGQPLQ